MTNLIKGMTETEIEEMHDFNPDGLSDSEVYNMLARNADRIRARKVKFQIGDRVTDKEGRTGTVVSQQIIVGTSILPLPPYQRIGVEHDPNQGVIFSEGAARFYRSLKS